MYSVTKIFHVPIGHRLSKHKGLCQNYHGHNYKIEVKVSSEYLNENEMVIDFSDLKKMVSYILDNFDHALMLNSSDPSSFNIPCKVIFLGKETDPTAELLCKYLYNEICSKIFSYKDLQLDSVKVWETDDAYAEYTGG